jgi:Ca2+/Na+ antiporter
VIWIVLGGLGLVVLIVASVVGGFIRLVFAPHREALSQNQFWLLAVLGVIAFVAMLVAAATVGGGWFVAPIALWLLVTAIVRNSAPERETKQQRIAREASERKRAAARKAVAERKRVDALGKDGIGLMERATLAVDTIMATEAGKVGWLGKAADLDFAADLSLITEALRQARRIEKVAAESRDIPQSNDDDKKLLRDAERTVKQLHGEVTRRVQLLNDCARQARQVDKTLAKEREQARFTVLRDDVSKRLAVELYGAEATLSLQVSNAADAVTAHVAAFKELKGIVDEQRTKITPPADSVSGDSAAEPDNVISWIRRQLSL